jgi:hypothetical protein
MLKSGFLELDAFFFCELYFSLIYSLSVVGNFLSISFSCLAGGFRHVMIWENDGIGVKF